MSRHEVLFAMKKSILNFFYDKKNYIFYELPPAIW